MQRYVLWQYGSSLPNIYISEFPKSGGTWLSQMISAISGLPFPRNTYITSRANIVHSHLQPQRQMQKSIVIIRDGRDVMVSAYHHFIIPNNHCPKFEQTNWRQWLQADDITNVRKNLSKFIEIFHNRYTVGGKKVTWSKHVSDSCPKATTFITYEALRTDPVLVLQKVISCLKLDEQVDLQHIVDKFSFDNQKKHSEETSFLRKGIVGDWKNYFNAESAKRFDTYAGETLYKYGYIDNQKWYEHLEG